MLAVLYMKYNRPNRCVRQDVQQLDGGADIEVHVLNLRGCPNTSVFVRMYIVFGCAS
jgi:hypothetical protein